MFQSNYKNLVDDSKLFSPNCFEKQFAFENNSLFHGVNRGWMFSPGLLLLIHIRTRKIVFDARTNILICVWIAYMVHSIFIMRIKSLQSADNLNGLFAAGGHGRGWPDPAGSRRGT